MVSLRPVDASNYRECIELSVAPEQQVPGRGHGRDALEAIVELVRDRGLGTVRLSVVQKNEQALEFYRRNGFAETGAIHGGEIVMERLL